MQVVLQPYGRAPRLQEADRGIDQGRRQALARNERAIGAAAEHECFAQHGCRQPGIGFGRIGIERGQQDRPPQPVVDFARACHCRPDGRPRGRPQETQDAEVVEHAGARHAASGIENPPAHASGVRPQAPALARRQIDEGKLGVLRPAQAMFGADQFEERQRRMVAGQQEMIAVIDDHADGVIVEGAAAAARLRRGLVHHDICTGVGEPNRSGEAGDTCADHMGDGAAHQIMA